MINGRLTIHSDPIAALQNLRRTAIHRILRKAVRNGAKPVVKAVRASIDALGLKESGALRQSIGTKISVRSQGGSGGPRAVTAVVGPRFDYTRTFDGELRRPAKYAHLVGEGRKAVTAKGKVLGSGTDFYGKTVKAAPGKPFLDRALAASREEYVRIVAEVVAAEIEKELAKGAK